MKFPTLFLIVVLAAIAAFAALNWGLLMAPATLSLGVTEVQGPLGLVMLGLLAIVTTLFLVFVVYLQTSVLLEARRHARELQANRQLADQAEASRFTELRRYLEAEFQKLSNPEAASRAAMLERLDQVERNLRASVEQSGNTVTAYIGELEDRLEKGTHGLPRTPPA